MEADLKEQFMNKVMLYDCNRKNFDCYWYIEEATLIMEKLKPSITQESYLDHDFIHHINLWISYKKNKTEEEIKNNKSLGRKLTQQELEGLIKSLEKNIGNEK